MTIAYFGYGNPTPDSTDLTVQRPDFGTNVTCIYKFIRLFKSFGFSHKDLLNKYMFGTIQIVITQNKVDYGT